LFVSLLRQLINWLGVVFFFFLNPNLYSAVHIVCTEAVTGVTYYVWECGGEGKGHVRSTKAVLGYRGAVVGLALCIVAG
jgi:hypothetical protein